MMEEFAPCGNQDLTGDVHQGAPDVHLHRDVLYIPKGFWPNRKDSALYDRAGRLILGSAQFAGHPAALKFGTPLTRPLNPVFLPRSGRAIFGGVIADHFGHFITECLNALWYYRKRERPDDPVVFLTNKSVDEIFSNPWMSRLLNHAGIGRDQVVIPDFETVFEELVIPGQALSEDDFIFSEFATFCAEMGDAAPESHWDREVYWLSKSALTSGNYAFEGEKEIESVLERHGVGILTPETMDLDSQLSLHRSGRLITGMVGSAFHTTIFSRSTHGLCFSPDVQVRRTYHLMDAVHDARIDYLWMKNARRGDGRDHFNASFHLDDPVRVGEAILREIDRKIARSAGAATTAFPRPASRPKPFRAYSLRSASNQDIRIDLFDGRLHVTTCDFRWHAPVLLLVSGSRAFLATDHPDSPAMSIQGEPIPSPVLSFDLVPVAQGMVALRHPVRGTYLCLPPAETGGTAHVNAERLDVWERVHLTPDAPLTVRHQTLIADLSAALAGDSVDDAAAASAVARFGALQVD
ncbi:glycosyltransferase family 61 protein [Acidomonas methanolica]|uniref:glycosyltransferase family 61 protein n=1 Tax=Acidomonas methanolica TaxID=437 RepID=UPI00211A8E35|nr:glycosyltransferase 61 family protein [Acidomonas methanolica]MCQ9155813.1 glycosyltransferase family 61 protein [Acidomonas methanolica]